MLTLARETIHGLQLASPTFKSCPSSGYGDTCVSPSPHTHTSFSIPSDLKLACSHSILPREATNKCLAVTRLRLSSFTVHLRDTAGTLNSCNHHGKHGGPSKG